MSNQQELSTLSNKDLLHLNNSWVARITSLAIARHIKEYNRTSSSKKYPQALHIDEHTIARHLTPEESAYHDLLVQECLLRMGRPV